MFPRSPKSPALRAGLHKPATVLRMNWPLHRWLDNHDREALLHGGGCRRAVNLALLDGSSSLQSRQIPAVGCLSAPASPGRRY